MEHTSGIPLSLTPPNIWRGGNKSNGQLMKLHTNHLSVAYASLTISAALQVELTAAGLEGVPFGNGLFYDRYIKSTGPNKVYAGYPTAVTAIPKLAGIMAYDAALASMQPVNSRGVMPYNKGVIVKRGFLRYKTGKAGAGGAAVAYADIDDATMAFFIENVTGDPVFAVPTGYGLSDAEAASLATQLQAKNITLPAFAEAATVAEVVTALSGVSVAVPGVTEAIALKVAAALKLAKPQLADCTYAGKIVHLYPEDESVLVELDF